MKAINHHGRQIIILASEDILSYLLEADEELDTLITCQAPALPLVTSDLAIYEALGSITATDEFKLPRLVKLFETVYISSGKKKVLDHGRAEELREKALSRRQ